MSILDLKKPTDAAPLISPEDAAAYMKTLKTPVDMPEEPADIIPNSIKEISQAYKGAGGGLKGGLAATLSGLGNAAKYLHTSSGQKIMAGLVGGNMMPGFLNNAENAKAEEQRKMDIARASQQSRFNAIGDLVREQGKELGENKRAAEKNATDIEVANIGLKRPGIGAEIAGALAGVKSYESGHGANKADAEKDYLNTKAEHKSITSQLSEVEALNMGARSGKLANLKTQATDLTGIGAGSAEYQSTKDVGNQLKGMVVKVIKSQFGAQLSDAEREYMDKVYGAAESMTRQERAIAIKNIRKMTDSKLQQKSDVFKSFGGSVEVQGGAVGNNNDPLGLGI